MPPSVDSGVNLHLLGLATRWQDHRHSGQHQNVNVARNSLTADLRCNVEFCMLAQRRMHVTGTSTNITRRLATV